MLKTKREKAICKKYGAQDKDGYVHCHECPLNPHQGYDILCKATAHYNRHAREWELDDDEKENPLEE